uniref:Uncharacterized protein n=1 Tax=Panstrongylus lignarius TaxID=156445 RepID=A0A224Y192_9HEMI
METFSLFSSGAAVLVSSDTDPTSPAIPEEASASMLMMGGCGGGVWPEVLRVTEAAKAAAAAACATKARGSMLFPLYSAGDSWLFGFSKFCNTYLPLRNIVLTTESLLWDRPCRGCGIVIP